MDLFKVVHDPERAAAVKLMSPSQSYPTIGMFAETSRKDAQREDLCW